MSAKEHYPIVNGGIKPLRFLYTLLKLNPVNTSATKKGNSDGTMGSKSKTEIMKSYEINKKEVGTKLKKQKKENALEIISKSS